MNSEYLALQIAAETKENLIQSDLMTVRSKITMAAAIGKEEATASTKYELSKDFTEALSDYGIHCQKVSSDDTERVTYRFEFSNVEV
ncbi:MULTISPECIES: hypothetical protein [unclassified Levilactobacillus]|uniref:hypothetical protein n=1 Tax=unclassified Levilactobacillus TaxID=2767918 RepID=UPI002FF41174